MVFISLNYSIGIGDNLGISPDIILVVDIYDGSIPFEYLEALGFC